MKSLTAAFDIFADAHAAGVQATWKRLPDPIPDFLNR